MSNYFIFRVNRSNDHCEYLTADRKTFSDKRDDAVLMTEAEASDNCGEYSNEEYDAGCGC